MRHVGAKITAELRKLVKNRKRLARLHVPDFDRKDGK